MTKRQPHNSRPFAMARPSALPQAQQNPSVQAYTPANVIERFGDEAATMRPASLAIGDNVITIFGMVGEDYWAEDGGITAKKVRSQLYAIGDRPVEVWINSPGGDMFEGIAIYNVLRLHSAEVTVRVIGMAASAASIVMMAGDKVEIGASAFMMIHNCWVYAMGNRNDLREIADTLEPFDEAMAATYAQRTGKDIAQVRAWMDKDTWMSGTTAIANGFADALLEIDVAEGEEPEKAQARKLNELRAMEVTLVGARGMTRAQARERLNKIKSTPGAALEDDTPGAVVDPWGDPETLRALAALNDTMQQV